MHVRAEIRFIFEQVDRRLHYRVYSGRYIGNTVRWSSCHVYRESLLLQFLRYSPMKFPKEFFIHEALHPCPKHNVRRELRSQLFPKIDAY